MQYYPFDSRNTLYRPKPGAAREGEALTLRLLLSADAKCTGAFLQIKNDCDGAIREISLTPREWLENYRFFDCEITPDEGLYWYRFRYISDYGEFFVTKTEHSLGIVSALGDWWQLTVYKRDFTTPEWLYGGIIYQIFPDRFYNSGKEKQNVPDDRYICTDPSKQPEFRQNNGICSLGNDYYGGDFAGIEEKLPYLKSLGVSCIYLNPVFEAHSNHRYNTADYMKTDPLLGSEEDLISLCRKAEGFGISIILDGVFSHTGDDSRYFNKYRRYGDGGAYNSQDSKYSGWYSFQQFPDRYSCWWGVPSLPETNEENPSFSEFITGENGVISHWLRCGVRGFRLDVADELPDGFLDKLRHRIKFEMPDSYLLGEVWEDATNKISQGGRRRFLRGRQLDSVMNYPFADAIIKYLTGGNSREVIDLVLEICENYPPCCIHTLMNHIGTHDTARILTVLGRGRHTAPADRFTQSQLQLTADEYDKGIRFLKLAAVLQYTLPGVPSLYYGDEAGMEGFGDPFCRVAYPWGRENKELLTFYRKLGGFRRESDVFRQGDFIPVYANFGDIIYIRKTEGSAVLVAVNRWCDSSVNEIPEEFSSSRVIFGNPPDGNMLTVDAESFCILEIKQY